MGRWSRRQESNLYLPLRRRPFYPLNYGEMGTLVRQAGHKPVRKSHPTKAKATEWARGIEAKLDAGEEIETDAVTVGELITACRALRAASRPILDNSNEHYMLKALD